MGEIRGDDLCDTNADTGRDDSVYKMAENLFNVNNVSSSKAGSISVKKYRRKSSSKKTGDSNGPHERPKKRPREDGDPFGLDKIIGIMADRPSQDGREVTENGSSADFCTPDLNQQAGGGESNGEDTVYSEDQVRDDGAPGLHDGVQVG
ncbi:hypothetical protein Hanom_Chr09g00813001 [Helianthus anomalus]